MIGEKKRYWELDFVRGLCVLLMIFDHAMFSFADVLPGIWEMFNVKFFGGLPDLALDYWTWNFRQVFRIFVFTAFFVLCGISCTFSRSNLKRGIKAFLVATAITLAVCEIFTRMSKLLYFADLGQLDLVMAIKVILPIHFCQIMVWVIIVAILIDNKPMITFSALCGLLASLFYLAYPIEGLSASFLHVRAFNSIFTHSLAFVTSINMMLLGMVKFKLKDFKITIGLLLCIVAYGFVMNLVFPGENYMFMIENPTSLSFGPVPYQLVFALLVLGFLSIFYLVPYWIEKRKSQKEQ